MTGSLSGYDRDYALHHSVPADDWLFDEILAQLAPQPGWRILDVGCNTGELTARLAAMQCRTLGIDINDTAIAIARQRFPALEFQTATLESMEAQAFDAITASHLIEHLTGPAAFLRAARRALKPRGKIVLATPNRRAWPRRFASIFGRVSFFHDPTHQRFFSAGEMREMLQSAGFHSVRTSTRRLYFPLAGRLPRRLRLQIPTLGMGDHLFAIACAPSAQTNGITGKLNRKSA